VLAGVRPMIPGLLLSIGVGIACLIVSGILRGVSALLLAVLVGIALKNLRLLPRATVPGIRWSSKPVLRAGIVILGLQLSLHSLVGLGWGGLTVIILTVIVTFLGTLLAGRLLRVSRVSRFLIATGFAICGASAVAAMSSIVDPDQESEDEVAQAIALVTLYGTLALFALPLLKPLAGLDDGQMGLWIGASVHEVAQVVAAAGAVSATALAVGTVAKLSRVVLLAPLVAIVGAIESVRRRSAPVKSAKAPPIVPLFVLGFLAAVAARSFLPLPEPAITVAGQLSSALLAIAMFGLGTGVDLRSMARTGARTAALGAISTALAATVSLVGIHLLA
jgi:uncharacterized integral membrane protein (TIGR00698 family)